MRYCLIGLALGWATGALAAAPGKVPSADYQLSVDGKGVEVVSVPKPETGIWNARERQPYSYAPFTATGTVEVCVRSRACDLSKAVILPRSKGVAASSQAADAVVFKLTPPMTVVLEPQGRHRALVVSANLPEAKAPRKDDPKVKWFGPGFHRANRISLGDGETLYLAPGAWVEGYVLARGRDITVCGSGVLSGACWDWRKGPPESQSFNMSGTLTTFSGENITVRDATFFSSWGWTLVFNCATNVLVDNVKVVCGRVINDDGWLWGRRPVDELHPMARNVGESIHVYDPHAVTHYGVNVPKDGRLGPCPPWPPKGCASGRDWLRKNFCPAWTKAEKEGCFLHLGEFGTYYQCPHATALAWMEDVLAVAREKKLGWALWNLDGKFGLMDNGRTDCALEDFEGHKLDRAMLALLQRYAQD